MDEWAIGLGGMSGEQIRTGLDTWDEPWPPSLSEFRAACRGHTDGWEHRSQAYKPFTPALPAPRLAPDVVEQRIAQLREALK
jgi:hypothetical protein